MASGGLTHFVIDEDFDQSVISAMKNGDEAALSALPESYFKVGTAEIKNWIPVIAAMNTAGLKYHQIDYVPVLSIGSGHGQRDVLRILAVIARTLWIYRSLIFDSLLIWEC